MSAAENQAVFLSYASQDAGTVLRIADALRAAGVVVWFDQNELGGGDAWDAKIRRQIAECALFVPVISAATQARLEGYFRIEWKLAAQRTHAMADEKAFILPIVIDGTRDHEAKVPPEFRAVQWTWFSGGTIPPGFGERVQRLLAGRAENQSSGGSPALAPTPAPTPEAQEGNFWVAVLPFKHRGTDAELAALGEGMTEGVVTGLSRFNYLRVIARSSTLRYAGEAVDVRCAGRELGARYVMEGSLRQSGGRLRATVQLVDAASGAHLWAEHYDRSFSPEAVFDLQDDLVARIVATVADGDGVLVRGMSAAVRSRDIGTLTPYEAIVRFCGFGLHFTAAEHAQLRLLFERLVQSTPSGRGECWAVLSFLYACEFSEGFNPLPDALGRAEAAAHRAIVNYPTNTFSHYALARCLFHRREVGGSRAAAERALANNPLDCGVAALVGILLTGAGDWERACAVVRRARELNPHHPGWYWFPEYVNAYRQADYSAALEIALKINMPGYYWAHLALAAVYGQLGQLEAAGKEVKELLAVRPDFAAIARAEMSKAYTAPVVEQLIDGLRKAGLEIEASTSP